MTVSDLLKQHGLSVTAVARQLRITPSAISQWQQVPAERVMAFEGATKIPRHKIRPDLYPKEREIR